MVTVAKALILNVGVFEAHSSVKKSKGAYSLNYANTESSVTFLEMDIAPGAGFTWQSPISDVAVTMVRVTGGPVKANVTLAEVVNVRAAPDTFLTNINQFMILDDNVSAITFHNTGSSVVSIAITQG